MLLNYLPLYLLLLVVDSTPASANVVPSAIQKAHRFAIKHSRGLAQDLRVAFGGVLVSQQQATTLTNTRVIHCKSGSSLGGGGTSSGNTTTGSSSGSGSGGSVQASGTATAAGSSSTSSVNSPWKLVNSYAGTNFFDDWTFWTLADPTHGIVDYIDEDTARSNNLIEVNSAGNAVMRVDTTQTVTSSRQSIRITTNATFNGGLFILDAVHMPSGCGTWPAFWTNGPNWPAGGEIDIVEGVNDYTNNQATIHTNPGCTIPSSSSSALNITGAVVGGTNCAAAETNNAGCGIQSSSNVSYGAAFNNNGGGVYAMQWDNTGIKVFFFERSNIPSDITNGTPLPSNWGQPMANWPATDCNPSTYFYTHSAIFDTTLCGDWAGSVWNASGSPGQAQSCSTRTGFSTCDAFVLASGSSFADAYWEIKSVNVYQTS